MGSCFQLLSSKQRYCRSSLLLRRTLNSSQVIVHLGIKTYLNHIISECLPSPELLQPTAPEAPSPNGKNQPYQHDGFSPLLQPPTPEHSKLLLNERTLTPPLSSLVLELPPLELQDQELVSVQYSDPSSLVTQETHPSNNNFSHTPFWVSLCLKLWVSFVL